ncbi:hypothetical protein I4I83_14275 [Acidovorax cattleyae]|nr:hypothetical protein [Paracidovorax cattleyae]
MDKGTNLQNDKEPSPMAEGNPADFSAHTPIVILEGSAGAAIKVFFSLYSIV